MLPLFTRRGEREVQGLMVKLLNNHSAELDALIEGPRLEGRVRLCIPVVVIPMEEGQLHLEQAFAAVTKEFSSVGVSLVLCEPRGLDEAVLAFRYEREMRFVRGEARHLNPMGAGFYQIGFRLKELIHPGDYPELQEVHF
ncbi:MAG TPA: hypothetical protein EYP56_15470 [Planctomycetaceae bacterium]|nr:hypothetical protein [Planctomycetaceae bacterium]